MIMGRYHNRGFSSPRIIDLSSTGLKVGSHYVITHHNRTWMAKSWFQSFDHSITTYETRHKPTIVRKYCAYIT